MSGFGYDKTQSGGYHFQVSIAKTGEVRIVERVSGDDTSNDHRRVKATISRTHWEAIRQAVQAEFNRRLKRDGLGNGRWNKVTTSLAPYFGKELTLLAWAIEDHDPIQINRILANWSGLAPEERWWFYTTIDASNRAHDAATGWLAGFRLAMLDDPREPMMEPESEHSGHAREAIADASADMETGSADKTEAIQQGRLFADPAATES